MDKITKMLENVVRCKYFEAGVHTKNPIKNSSQDGLGRTTLTLDHVVVVHISIWDKRKSPINEYSDLYRITDFWSFFDLWTLVQTHLESVVKMWRRILQNMSPTNGSTTTNLMAVHGRQQIGEARAELVRNSPTNV